MTTKAEKRYLDRVASLPCQCCGAEGVHVHHVREGQGMAQRAQNWLAVALCPACHSRKTRLEVGHKPAPEDRLKWRESVTALERNTDQPKHKGDQRA